VPGVDHRDTNLAFIFPLQGVHLSYLKTIHDITPLQLVENNGSGLFIGDEAL
jgi:hypothetical protein